MEMIFYSPPVIFGVILILGAMVLKWLGRYSNKSELGEHTLDPYACGQRDVENYVNPDYSQFYSYAFIFTVVHILIMVVATAPADAQVLPVIYIVSGVLALLIAFKR